MLRGTSFKPASFLRTARGLLAATAILGASGATIAQTTTRDLSVLQFVEKRLAPNVTTAIPPDFAEGKHIATDAELRVAFSLVLRDFLVPPSTFAGKASELIAAVCNYRPAQTPQWIEVATDALLAQPLSTTGQDLEDSVTAAVAANPNLAAAVTRAALRRIATHYDTFTRADAESGKRFAARVLFAAIKVVKTADEPIPRLKEIVREALAEAVALQSSALVLETMTTVMKGGSGTPGFVVGDFARLGLVQCARTKQQAGIVCAGALRGAGAQAASTIKDQAALNLPVPFAAYTTIVCNAYLAATTAASDEPFEIARFITLNNADYIPAAMLGAIVAHPETAAEILRGGLNRDLVLHGQATTREILGAAITACEERAPELANAALGRGDLAEGNAATLIAEGLALGTPAPGLAAAFAAQLQGEEQTAAGVKSAVAGAVAGAIGSGKFTALSAIAATAATDHRFAADALDQMLVSVPPDRQCAAVFGVLVASPDDAPALLERALHSPDLVAGQAKAVAAGGRLILEIQANSLCFFTVVRRSLLDPESASSGIAEALVLAASLVNPRGAAHAAAVAAVATDLAPDTLTAAAASLDSEAEPRIAQAVAIARDLSGRPFELFRKVRQQIADQPEFAPEIVAGAMAAAPTLGHVVGQAAAFAAPGAIAQIVPRLFAFTTIVSGDDPRETFAALVRGAIHGALDAEEDRATEIHDVAEVVAAAVKSVIALKRDPAAAPGPNEAALVAAVITAATFAAGDYALDISRIAARTARTLSSVSSDPATIRDAVLAANPPTSAGKIADAVNAGIAEADAQIRAAEVRALIDYAHDSLTGAPMTNFLDL